MSAASAEAGTGTGGATQARGGRATVRGALVLLGGQAGGQALGFVRNIIVARMISPAHFGIAATFAVTMALLNMLGDLSIDKLLVQAKDGDEPRVQSTAQLIQVVRGAISALLLAALGGLVADAFGAPEAAWAFRVLALVPFIRGFQHLDVRRVQRELKFVPATLVDGVPQLLATLATWPLAVWLGDYRVVLYAALLQEVAATIASHLLAERRYAWSRDREVARRIAKFGWPLVVNALLMFGIFQGDRVVIGTSYSLEQLGAYSVAFMLTIVPTALLAGAATSLVLPVLSRVQDDPRQFESRTAACAQTIALASALITIPLALVGGPAVVAIFGSKYAAAAYVVPWLAAMQGVRMLRITPTLAAVAKGDTVNSMMSNVCRSTALFGMIAAAFLEADVVWIAAAGLGGELFALAYACRRLSAKQGVPARVNVAPAALALATSAFALACAVALDPAAGRVALPAAIALALQAAGVVALFAAFPELRRFMRALLPIGPRSVALGAASQP